MFLIILNTPTEPSRFFLTTPITKSLRTRLPPLSATFAKHIALCRSIPQFLNRIFFCIRYPISTVFLRYTNLTSLFVTLFFTRAVPHNHLPWLASHSYLSSFFSFHLKGSPDLPQRLREHGPTTQPRLALMSVLCLLMFPLKRFFAFFMINTRTTLLPQSTPPILSVNLFAFVLPPTSFSRYLAFPWVLFFPLF